MYLRFTFGGDLSVLDNGERKEFGDEVAEEIVEKVQNITSGDIVRNKPKPWPAEDDSTRHETHHKVLATPPTRRDAG